MSFQMNTFSPFDLTNICQDTYLGKMFRSISIMYFWRFVIKFSWNKKLLELKKNAIKLKFCCLTMVFLYIPGFLPQAWNMPYPRRKAICKKKIGQNRPIGNARTTDARWRNHLHCTAKNQPPNSEFLGTAESYFVCHIGSNFQISLIYAFIGCP